MGFLNTTCRSRLTIKIDSSAYIQGAACADKRTLLIVFLVADLAASCLRGALPRNFMSSNTRPGKDN